MKKYPKVLKATLSRLLSSIFEKSFTQPFIRYHSHFLPPSGTENCPGPWTTLRIIPFKRAKTNHDKLLCENKSQRTGRQITLHLIYIKFQVAFFADNFPEFFADFEEIFKLPIFSESRPRGVTFIKKLIYKGRFCFAIYSGFVLDCEQSLSSSKTVGKNAKQIDSHRHARTACFAFLSTDFRGKERLLVV